MRRQWATQRKRQRRTVSQLTILLTFLHANIADECQRKQKELKEWDLIEVDRRGKTTLKTIKSDRPKDRFWSLEKFDGMAMVDEPLVRVRHKDSEVVFTEEQKKRMAEVAKEMKKDGDKEFVVL